MIQLKLYRGKVSNIDDPDKLGKIQIRILPELYDKQLKDDDLPWFEPFFGTNGDEMKKQTPKKDTIVWCLIDDIWKRRYYLDYFNRKSFFDFDIITTALGSISEVSNKEYQYLDFYLYSEGSLDFFNNNTSERGTIYKDGTYVFHDKDGNLFANTVNKAIKVYNSKSSIELPSDGKAIVKSSVSITLNGLKVNVTGGSLEVNGSCAPTGTGGFCALVVDPFTGTLHTGNTISGT